MSEDWLKKWYREKYTLASAETSQPRVWNAINATIKEWWKSWYTANAQEARAEGNAAASNWRAIEMRLKLQAQIRRQTKLRHVRFACVSLLVILSPFILGELEMNAEFLQSKRDTNFNSLLEAFNSEEGKSISSGIETNEPQAGFIAQTQQKAATSLLSSISNDSRSDHTELPSDSRIRTTSPDLTVDQTNFTLEALPVQPISDIVANNPLRQEFAHTSDIEGIRRPLWMFGINVNQQFSSLMNPTLQMGFDNKSHITNLLGSCNSFDLSAMRKIGPESWIQAVVRLNDKKSQVYKDFIGSEYQKKSILLNYQTVSLSYRRSLFSKFPLRRFGFEFSTGIYGSYLSSVEEHWGDEERFVMTEGFKSCDFGVRLGAEGVFSLKRNLDLTGGIYYNNGIMNVFHGIDKIPAYFYRTYTSSFGASVGIRYKLSR